MPRSAQLDASAALVDAARVDLAGDRQTAKRAFLGARTALTQPLAPPTLPRTTRSSRAGTPADSNDALATQRAQQLHALESLWVAAAWFGVAAHFADINAPFAHSQFGSFADEQQAPTAVKDALVTGTCAGPATTRSIASILRIQNFWGSADFHHKLRVQNIHLPLKLPGLTFLEQLSKVAKVQELPGFIYEFPAFLAKRIVTGRQRTGAQVSLKDLEAYVAQKTKGEGHIELKQLYREPAKKRKRRSKTPPPIEHPRRDSLDRLLDDTGTDLDLGSSSGDRQGSLLSSHHSPHRVSPDGSHVETGVLDDDQQLQEDWIGPVDAFDDNIEGDTSMTLTTSPKNHDAPEGAKFLHQTPISFVSLFRDSQLRSQATKREQQAAQKKFRDIKAEIRTYLDLPQTIDDLTASHLKIALNEHHARAQHHVGDLNTAKDKFDKSYDELKRSFCNPDGTPKYGDMITLPTFNKSVCATQLHQCQERLKSLEKFISDLDAVSSDVIHKTEQEQFAERAAAKAKASLLAYMKGLSEFVERMTSLGPDDDFEQFAGSAEA